MPAEVHHPIFARCYERLTRLTERELATHRREVLAGLTGRIVEIGAGNGMNFAHYPSAVEEVTALEPEPYLRGKAQGAAREAPVPVRVEAATADSLPFPDGEFDAAVVTLVLCTVPSPASALAELRRVLRPEGELRFMEHVRSHQRPKAKVQRAFDRSGVWPCLAGACHCARDTVRSIDDAGFAIQRSRSFDLGPSWVITNPHVTGIARRGA